MPQINAQLFDSLIDQADAAGSQSGGRKSLRRWIEKNIRHPTKDGKPWSWVDHEYQLGIVEESHPTVYVQKPAQSGISELAVNITLGLLGVFPNSNIIYALQSKTYAQTFASSRISPAINKSPKLRELINKDVDSTSLKQIGSSFLHITGTHSESSAISVPASALIIDELSFANPGVLGTLASRLEHHKEEDKIVFGFSTPLYSNMGISAAFDQGNQSTYMVYHEACGHWVPIEPLTDYIIPGFNESLDKFDRKSLSEIDPDKAYVKCQQCGNEISRQNLADKSKRAWVPKYLEKTGNIGTPHSYQVHPTDVSGIKSMGQIIRSMALYKTTDRWFQYGLGLPYDAGGGQIIESVARKAFSTEHFSPENGKLLYGCVLGLDVGKTSHLTIARKVDGKMVVVRMETVKQDFEGALQTTVVDRMRQFNCVMGVSDAQPDHTAVRAIQEHLPMDMFYGGYFVRAMSGSIDPFKVKEADGMVAIARTRMIDAFVDMFNKGNVVLPQVVFKEEVVSHLLKVKRITDEKDTGDDASRWIKLDANDHWFFSLLYCYVALEIADNESSKLWLPSSLVGMSRISMRV